LLAVRWNAEEEQWNSIGPPPPRDLVRVIVGYAFTCKLRLPAVANTIEEARYQARKHNRSRLLATDIRAALLNYQIPSDAALQQAFRNARKGQNLRRDRPTAVATKLEFAVPLL
jgi:hypothetical protein